MIHPAIAAIASTKACAMGTAACDMAHCAYTFCSKDVVVFGVAWVELSDKTGGSKDYSTN